MGSFVYINTAGTFLNDIEIAESSKLKFKHQNAR